MANLIQFVNGVFIVFVAIINAFKMQVSVCQSHSSITISCVHNKTVAQSLNKSAIEISLNLCQIHYICIYLWKRPSNAFNRLSKSMPFTFIDWFVSKLYHCKLNHILCHQIANENEFECSPFYCYCCCRLHHSTISVDVHNYSCQRVPHTFCAALCTTIISIGNFDFYYIKHQTYWTHVISINCHIYFFVPFLYK